MQDNEKKLDKEAFVRFAMLLVNATFLLFGATMFVFPDIVLYKFEIIGLYIAVVTGQYVARGIDKENKTEFKKER